MTKTNAGPIFSADRLRSFVERIERLEEERKAIGGDIRDVYSEAKGVGYDVKIMRKVVQLRKMDAADRDEQEQMLDTYWHALSTVDRIEARAAAGESAREIAAAENVSKSTAHRVSQKARSQNANKETGHAPDSQEDSVLSGRGEGTDEQEAPAALEVVCAVDAGRPCPNTCAREGQCVWDTYEPLPLTRPLGAVAEGDSPQRVATQNDDGLDLPAFLKRERITA